jgi:hypothetical protein
MCTFAENSDTVKAGWIPYYCEYHFLGLTCWSFPFGHLFTRLKPGQLVVGTEIKPRFIKWYNTGGSISSGARAREAASRNVFLKDGFTHDRSLHCFLKPITLSLPSG